MKVRAREREGEKLLGRYGDAGTRGSHPPPEAFENLPKWINGFRMEVNAMRRIAFSEASSSLSMRTT